MKTENKVQLKVYFASPFFTPEQIERETRLKAKLRELGFNVWSPSENCNLSPISDPQVRNKVFAANVYNIVTCDILFAITDGKDMGTVWESGFACGINHMLDNGIPKIKIVYYCETLGDGMFNLMLAQSGDIVITKFQNMDMLPQLISEDRGLEYAGVVE